MFAGRAGWRLANMGTSSASGGAAQDIRGGQARLRSGALWNLIVAVSTQGATFVTNLMLTRILGGEGFGKYAAIANTLLTVATVAQVATGYTATKYVAELRAHDSARTLRICRLLQLVCVWTGLAGALLIFAGAGWMTRWLFGVSELETAVRMGTVFVFFSCLNGLQSGVLAGFEAYRDLALAGMVGGGFAVVATVGAAVGYGYEGAISSMALTAAARWVAHAGFVRRVVSGREGPCGWRDAMGEFGVITHFALPAALSGFLLMPAVWLANAMLVKQPGGVEQFGVYSAAYTLRTLVLFVPGAVTGAAMSVLNSLRGAGAVAGFRRVFWISIVMAGTAAVVMALCLQFLASWLFGLFGRDFSGGNAVLPVLLVSGCLEAVALAVYQRLQASGRMWLSLGVVILPWQVVFLGVAWWLVPALGARGLAWASACGTGVFLGTTLLAVRWFGR